VAPVITAQPADLAVVSGTAASFTVAASGEPTPAISWEVSSDGGGLWSVIGGAANATCTFTASRADNQVQVRAVATNPAGSVTSNPATLTVQWLALTAEPAGEAVTAPDPACFTVAVDANPAPSFQWQSTTGGGNWTDVAGGTACSCATGATAPGDSGTQYRCIVANPAATLTSDPAVLSVNAPLAAPAITTQPASLQVYSNNSASFTAAASGNPSPTFTWEMSSDGGNIWATVSGAVASTYTVQGLLVDSGTQFRAVAANSQGTAISDPATLTVVPSVYAVGNVNSTSGLGLAGYWLNGTWIGLLPLDASLSAQAADIAVVGSDVYIGGYCEDSSGEQMPGYWLNGTWVGLGMPSGYHGGFVNCITLSGGNVYVAGYCYDSSYTEIASYWVNGNWAGLTPPSGQAAGFGVTALCVSGSDVYIAAPINSSSGVGIPGYWRNGTWVGLPALDNQVLALVSALVVSEGVVYAGGYCWTDGGQVPGYWVNGTWVGLPLLSGSSQGQVNAVAVSGGVVFAGGWIFINDTGVMVSGYWLNGIWVTLPGGGMVNTIVQFGSHLYAGGVLDGPGYWLDGTWVGLTVPGAQPYAEVEAMVVQ
jgi:hypothetical protein